MLKTVWLLSAIALYGLLVLISPYLGLAFGRFVVTAVLLAPPGVSAFVLARSLWKGLSRRGAPPPVAPGRPAVVLFRIGFLIAGGVLVAVSLNARMHLLQQSRQAHADARGREALESGDVNAGLVWSGQVQGLIHDVPSCRDLLERMVAGAEAIISGRLARLIAAEPAANAA